MIIKADWSSLKSFTDARGLSIQYVDYNGNYYLTAIDGPFEVETLISQELDGDGNKSSDCIDFETNYKANGNKRQSQFDTDGANIVRLKAAKAGWSFLAIAPEITTSTLSGSLYCKDSAGNDISGISCKIYDANNDEITTAGVLNANLNTCVKTVLDIELPYDYELIGGALRVSSNPAQDLRLWIVGAPDIPAMYGGSKEFASGINLKFLAPDSSFDIDGRVTKYITYNEGNHSGKVRLLLKHAAGLSVNMQIVMHLYRL